MFLYVVLLTVLTGSLIQTQELKYKVVTPKNTCSNDTIIRLVGEDVPHLKFNWSIIFDLNQSDLPQNLKQRYVLMVWRSVRNLNAVLDTINQNELNQTEIKINNTLLTPGVKYIINLTAEKQLNNTTIIKNDKIILEQINNNQSTLSVDLKGPEVTYSDISYTINAEVKGCSKNLSYQISWQLLDKSKIMLQKNGSKSNVFKLSPGTLDPGKEYSIKCIILDGTNNNSNVVKQLTVLEKGIKLSTFCKYLKIGVKQPIYLNAFYADLDYSKEAVTFKWTCINSAQKNCSSFNNNNKTELLIPAGFELPDRYLFTIKATKGKRTISDTSIVEVVNDQTPIIDIENAVTICNPSDSVKISAHVRKLFLGCTLQWTSVKNESGFSFVNLDTFLDNPGRLIKITEAEELDDFSNESTNDTSIEKQFDLFLPKSDNGLKGNSKYLFRLIASCPVFGNNSIEASSEDKRIVSSADVVINTNKLPLLKDLMVVPNSGEAMKTKFTFQTEHPDDNKPLLFKFGVKNKSNKLIYLFKGYETMTTTMFLPFYGVPIETILEVCDCNNACNMTMGPKVIVKLPSNYTNAEINELKNKFKQFMTEKDYYSAFTLSAMILQTVKEMPSNGTLNEFVVTINNVTNTEIKSYLKSSGKSWINSANNLLKYVKILDSEIELPQDVFNNILDLRDKISEKQNVNKKPEILEKLVLPTRKLLSVKSKKVKRIVNEINVEEIKNYLEISEIAIKRLSDSDRINTEKQKLLDTLKYYIPRICQHLHNNYKNNIRIVLSSLLLDVEKINIIRKYNEFLFVPFDTNFAGKIQIGRDLAERYRRQKGICLGKVLFLDDYFNSNQYVYDVKLYSALTEDYLDSNIFNYSVIMEMVTKNSAPEDQTFQCVLWEKQIWNSLKCKTLDDSSPNIKCGCKSMGFFSIVPVERTTTQTTTISTPPTNSELITQQFNEESTISSTVVTTVINVPTTTQQNLIITEKPTEIFHTSSSESSVETIQTVEQKNSYKTRENNTNSAALWSISLLSVGIGTLLIAFLVLCKKLQRSKAVQSFQTVEYARYIDEHNLE